MDFCRHVRAAQDAGGSLLCVGLDPETSRFPPPWRGDARRIADFCIAIVDATHDLAAAFKPQIAHFAAERAEAQLERVIDHCHRVAPGVPVILDAKRGDIGSTAEQYAREVFERYRADAVTLSPLLGPDSIEPYARHGGKGLILLCRTSNPGGDALQALRVDAGAGTATGGDGGAGAARDPANGGAAASGGRDTGTGDAARAGTAREEPGERLFEHIARLADGPWNTGGQLGLVVGATYPRELARVRELAPALPLLVPGVGAQGGDAQATVRAAWRPGSPVLVSASRAILYADPAAADPAAAADAARRAAQALHAQLQRAKPPR